MIGNTKMSQFDIMQNKAQALRKEALKLHKLSPETRIASTLSAIEIFVVLYYGRVLSYSENPTWKDRDRLIISKGHGSFCIYPILADIGYFDKKELQRIGSENSFLGAIPDSLIPGYETTNGSLGHGLGVGCGIALALKRKKYSQKVFVVAGDGELNEGSMWEAIMFASYHKLDNLILIVDNNKISMLGHQKDIIVNTPFTDRFKSFDWETNKVDGHNVEDLFNALVAAKKNSGKPQVVIAETVKGKGVAVLENKSLCHVMSLAPSEIDEILEGWE